METQFRIGQEELLLLTFMHENALGYGPQFKMDPAKIMGGLNMEYAEFLRYVSYLAEHRLAGLNTIDRSGRGDGVEGSFRLTTVFLTGFGEDYMRALEAEPTVARRVTVAVVKELWSMGTSTLKDIAAGTLARMFKP